MNNIKQSVVFILLVALTGWACSSDGNEEFGSAKIQVSLIDAPGDFDAVNIDIQDVQVNVGADSAGWTSLESADMGVFDLLKLTNGEEAFLGEIELPEGKLSQIRLVLGSANELKIDSMTYELTVPSGSQSGLKLNVNANIVAGVTYRLIIDFDVAKSIVQAGKSGKYNLKPVIRAEFEAATGAISGVVSPAEVGGVIYAILGSDSISTYSDETGAFLLRALAEGSYDVVAIPSDTSYQEASSIGVSVVAGEVATADSLIFEMK